MTKHILKNEDARKALAAGINEVADIVKTTLGPQGKNVVIRRAYNPPIIVNDGVSIAKEIKLADATMDAGAQLITSAAIGTNDNVGDGTTTTCILTQALVNGGFKLVENGTNPVILRNALKRAKESVLEALSVGAIKIDSFEKLKQVATISVGGDEVLGTLVAEALSHVGLDGIVDLEDSNYPETQLKLVEGYKMERGYMSPYFINNIEKLQVDFDDCRVVCSHKKINRIEDVLPMLNYFARTRENVLLIIEDISDAIFNTIVANAMKKTISICIVKSPGFGFNIRDYMEDVSALVGCQIADDAYPLEDFNTVPARTPSGEVQFSDFGIAKKVIVTREHTAIIAVDERKDAIAERVAALKGQLETVDNEHHKDSLKTRIAKLSTGVATIEVGASTETEQQEIKLRLEDAINAARSAMEGGIASGGGIALAAAGNMLLAINYATKNETKAAELLAEALQQPAKQVLENAGLEMTLSLMDISTGHGINAYTGEKGLMTEMGVIDPVNVLKAAVENAVSVASTVLTTEATIIAENAAS